MRLFRVASRLLLCCALTGVCLCSICERDVVVSSDDCEKGSPLESGCEFKEEYSVKCDSTCVASVNKQIWGTTNYSDDSSLCLCALHDRRISSWNTNKQVVTFRRIRSNLEKYHNTINQGIESLSKLGNATGYFYFTSRRIKEPLLDVTSLHKRYLYEPNEDSVQECHLAVTDKSRDVKFTYLTPIPEWADDLLRWSAHRKKYTSFVHTIFKVFWRTDQSDMKYVTGGVQCTPSLNDLSTITSMAMRNDALFMPNELTATVNYGEKVKLTMDSREENPCSNNSGTAWHKDTEPLHFQDEYETSNSCVLHHLVIESVHLGHAGVYSLQCKQDNSNYDKRGILRLIVRSCPAYLYGDHCNKRCPRCRNGGVCHDMLGVCICPPGFKGTNCENACGSDTFGRDCEGNCSTANLGNSNTCRGILFCLPDPYGCSCTTGFKGLDCETPCDSGYFGASCTQKCSGHCAHNASCDVFTGYCPDGCELGWKGEACVTPTYMPEILMSKPNSLELSFQASNSTLGQGTPATYVVEIQDVKGSGSFREVSRVDANDKSYSEVQKVIVDGLKPDTEYAVRVIVVDTDGNVRENEAATDVFRTTCGKPLETLQNLTVENLDSKTVMLSWKRPSPETLQCSDVSIQLSLNSISQSFEDITTDDDFYLLRSKPFMTWNVKARILTENLTSDWGAFERFTTDEDAPSAPRDLLILNVFTNGILDVIYLEWAIPEQENGVIRSYKVQLEHESFLSHCDFKPPLFNLTVDGNSNSSRFDFPRFYYHSQLKISVSAVTVKEGPPVSRSLYLGEKIPEASPRNSTVTNIEVDSCSVEWQAPDCQLVNGYIRAYNFTYQRLDEEEDDKIASMKTQLSTILLSNLTSLTKYRFRVSACTAVGCSHLYDEVLFETLPIPLAVNKEATNTPWTVIIIACAVTVAVLLSVGVAVFYVRMKKINEKGQGKDVNRRKEQSVNAEEPSYPHPDLDFFEPKWEFPKDKLELGATLGEGAFGKVLKAKAFGIKNRPVCDVAVKTLKDFAIHSHRSALLGELKVLVELGKHLNVVNLLGAVTNRFWNGELLVIVDCCRFGNLREFLQKSRTLFVNQLNSAPGDSITNVETEGNGACNDIPASAEVEIFDSYKRPITVNDLMSYSFQVARGMRFLSFQKIVHRDLAARNVLLGDFNIVKICDFGLSKDVYNDSNYVMKDIGMVPIKWSALESLSDKVYNLKTDVWSYGVFLWEVFSLGAEPYPGVHLDNAFYQRLKDGYRLERPDHASEDLYEVMLECWHEDPKKRPNFGRLEEAFEKKLSDQDRGDYLTVLESFNAEYTPMDSLLENPLEATDAGSYIPMTVTKKTVDFREANDNDNKDINKNLVYDREPVFV